MGSRLRAGRSASVSAVLMSGVPRAGREVGRAAAGQRQRVYQDRLIYAEDPYNDFLPYPGTITRLNRPMGPGVRLDGCVYDGWTVPMEYDPLLAKLVVWGATREQAIQRMIRALREYDVGGIRTNIGFFRQILEDEELRAGHLHTGFIEEFFTRHHPPQAPADLAAVAALAASLHTASRQAPNGRGTNGANAETPSGSAWLASGRSGLLR